MIVRVVGALLATLLACAAPAAAEERITRFVSDIEVMPDASLEVTETIDVVAENVRINRGIYRDFPTRYRGRRGNQVRVDFTLLGAQRDGYPELATTEPIANGVRIKIGNPDKTLDQGEHRFILRYRTTRQIGRFDGYDELYWNVTGSGWAFPINNAEARIRLPQAVKLGQRAFYTGPQGTTARNAEVSDEKPGEIAFRTTAPLGPYEGLTVAIAWPKGVVAEADSASRAKYWIADYGPLIVGALGLAGLLLFYYIAWQRAGRNPRAGPVVPLFTPPDGLTPAAMRYVWKWAPTTAPSPPLWSTSAFAAMSAWSRRKAASSRATKSASSGWCPRPSCPRPSKRCCARLRQAENRFSWSRRTTPNSRLPRRR